MFGTPERIFFKKSADDDKSMNLGCIQKGTTQTLLYFIKAYEHS